MWKTIGLMILLKKTRNLVTKEREGQKVPNFTFE